MTERIEYWLFLLISFMARHLSFRSAGRAGAMLGDLVFTLTPFRKSITRENLSKAFPEKDAFGIDHIARGAFRNYGTALVESLWARNRSESELRATVRLQNAEVMHAAVARGKGVIFLSAHFGSWELLPTAVRLHLSAPLTLVVQRQRNALIDAFIDASRSRFGNSTIPMGVSSRRVLTALAEKKIILMLGDQSGPKESIAVEFFGRPAATHRGVAAFSLKTGAPIVMGFLVRQPDRTYTMTFQEVETSGLTSSDEGVDELTRRHVVLLEDWIRKHPDHWLWMHKRWKHTAFFERQQPVEA